MSAAAQRRLELQAERAKSKTLREFFSEVSVVQIGLEFTDANPPPPSPQTHSMYPAARAYFRFACPCADCDGDFDLTGVVSELLKEGAPAKRAMGRRSATGKSVCEGIRWRDSNHSEPCRIGLTYRVVAGFEA